MGRKLVLEIVCLLAALFVKNSIVYGHRSDDKACETPDHWEGECVQLHKCPVLLALSEKTSKSENESAFLQQSFCGRPNLDVYVCCRFETIKLLPDARHCGQSLKNRMCRGMTHIDEHPWTVLIMFAKSNLSKSVCGGALINNRYVLTAAQCVTEDELASNMNDKPVRLGEWNITTDPDCEIFRNGQRYCADHRLDVGIEEVIRHPNFTIAGRDTKHDIALIRLDSYVHFTNVIQPVCLPVLPRLHSTTFEGYRLTLVGWGTIDTKTISVVKRSTNFEGVDLDECRWKYSTIGVNVLKSNICAAGKTDGKTCWGDYGGPLLSRITIDFRSVYTLIGVFSFSHKPCGHGNWPSVYTRVGAYIDWIEDNLKP